jgi:putative FmdB family regulatory protein
MPSYDFTCKECAHDFEQIQRSHTEGERKSVCPRCGGLSLWRPSGHFEFKFTFKEGYDACTGEYHPTKKHYENTIREKGLVKID